MLSRKYDPQEAIMKDKKRKKDIEKEKESNEQLRQQQEKEREREKSCQSLNQSSFSELRKTKTFPNEDKENNLKEIAPSP